MLPKLKWVKTNIFSNASLLVREVLRLQANKLYSQTLFCLFLERRVMRTPGRGLHRSSGIEARRGARVPAAFSIVRL